MPCSTLLLHVGALSYKNILVTRRQPVTSCCQCLCPLVFAFVLVVPYLFSKNAIRTREQHMFERDAFQIPERGRSSGRLKVDPLPRMCQGTDSSSRDEYGGSPSDLPTDSLGFFLNDLGSSSSLGFDSLKEAYRKAGSAPGRQFANATVGFAPQTPAVDQMKAALGRHLEDSMVAAAAYEAMDVCPPMTDKCRDLLSCASKRLSDKMVGRLGSCGGCFTPLRKDPLWSELEPRLKVWLLRAYRLQERIESTTTPSGCEGASPGDVAPVAEERIDAMLSNIDEGCEGEYWTCYGSSCSTINVTRLTNGSIAFSRGRLGYTNNEFARIRLSDIVGDGVLYFTYVSTEAGYDKVTVKNSSSVLTISGTRLQSVRNPTELTWRSDGGVTTSGWEAIFVPAANRRLNGIRDADAGSALATAAPALRVEGPTIETNSIAPSSRLRGGAAPAAASRRLSSGGCESLRTACDCATRPQECGWLSDDPSWNSRPDGCYSRSRRFAYSYVMPVTSCWECPSQAGCDDAALWATIGRLVRMRPNVRIFSSREALDEHMAGEGEEYEGVSYDESGAASANKLCAAVVLDIDSCVAGGNGDCEYTIRLNESSIDTSVRKEHVFPQGFWADWPSDYKDEFLPLQKWVDDFLLADGITGGAAPNTWYSFLRFPVAARRVIDNFGALYGRDGGIGFAMLPALGSIIIAYPVISRMLREKEDQLRDGMRMMGMSDAAYYSSQLVWVAAWSLVPSAFVTMLLYLSWTQHCVWDRSSYSYVNCEWQVGELFANSNGFWFFILYWLGCIAQACMGMLAVPLVCRARTGRMLAFGVLFLQIFVPLVAQNASPSAWVAMSLLPGVALGQGMKQAFRLEDANIGLTAATLGLEIENFAFATSLYMLVVDVVLYMLLLYYLDQTVKYGVGHRPFYFPLTCESWQEALGCGQQQDVEVERTKSAPGAAFEAPSEALMSMMASGRTLEVRGLRKQFADVTAVDGLDLTMYPGEVYVLLGHNGAGKTTTINCLTGLLTPTSGTASLFARPLWSLLRTMEGRRLVGICPQKNVLWNELSCMEHCGLFGAFRGLDRAKAKAGASAILTETGLGEKSSAAVSTLSGGMKRKLSLSLALLGDPDLCFLDEPSSGMDPTARRDTWDLLRRQKESRIIVLTTHYMDEADVLGDRIGIMSSGRLQCMGSPLFLKQHYGCGYNLSFDLADGAAHRADLIDLVSQEVRGAAASTAGAGSSGARVMAEAGNSVVLVVDYAASRCFPSLFRRLDDEAAKARLGLLGWSVAVCHLEEVFLRVARGDGGQTMLLRDNSGEVATNERQSTSRVFPTDAANAVRSEERPHHNPLAVDESASTPSEVEAASSDALAAGDVLELRPRAPRQAVALISKRVTCTRRDKTLLFCQVFCPVLVVVLIALILRFFTTSKPRVLFDLSAYNMAAARAGAPQTVVPVGTYPLMNREMRQAIVDGATRTPKLVDEVQELPLKLDPVPSDDPYDRSPLDHCRVQDPITLHDLAFRFSSELLGTTRAHAAARYAAVLPIKADSNGTHLLLVANTTADHIVPTTMNLGANMVRRALGVEGVVRTAYHPFPRSAAGKAEMYTDPTHLSITFAFILTCWVLPFSVAYAAAVIIREKEVGAKAQQYLSGVSPWTYWLANAIVDFAVFLVTLGLVFAVFAIAGFHVILHSEVFLCLLLFGLAQIPFSYLVGNLFQTAAGAQTAVLVLSVIMAAVLGLVGMILRSYPMCWRQEGRGPMDFDYSGYHTGVPPPPCVQGANEVWSPIFNFIPGVATWEALDIIAKVMQSLARKPVRERTAEWREACAKEVAEYKAFSWNCADSFLGWDAAAPPLLQLGLCAILYFFMVIAMDLFCAHPVMRSQFLDYRAAPVKKPEGSEDEAVLEQASSMPDPLSSACSVHEVRKVYGPVGLGRCKPRCLRGPMDRVTHAVKGVSFAIKRGEVFGLLGANGAGKSSLFDLLAGFRSATEGAVHVVGEDLRTGAGIRRARRQIGYCPQGNALLERMTAREHLMFYCRLKGVPVADTAKVVDAKLRHLELEQYARKYAGDLSGGNKRKLMVAVALIGDAPFILADEPSAGVDPVARRALWSVIQRIASSQHRSSVLLSTHSMEECEALCHRSAIMVNGVFRTIGTNRDIRDRYGAGFELMAKVARPTEAELMEIMRSWGIPEEATQGDTPSGVMTRSQLEPAYATDPYLLAALDGPTQPWAASGNAVGAGISPRVAAEWHALTLRFRGLHALVVQLVAPGTAYLLDWHGQMARYKLVTDQELGDIFAKVEEAKERLAIAEYSLSATTLEQIFNRFAREQEHDSLQTASDENLEETPEAAAVAVDNDNILFLAAQTAPCFMAANAPPSSQMPCD